MIVRETPDLVDPLITELSFITFQHPCFGEPVLVLEPSLKSGAGRREEKGLVTGEAHRLGCKEGEKFTDTNSGLISDT